MEHDGNTIPILYVKLCVQNQKVKITLYRKHIRKQ